MCAKIKNVDYEKCRQERLKKAYRNTTKNNLKKSKKVVDKIKKVC